MRGDRPVGGLLEERGREERGRRKWMKESSPNMLRASVAASGSVVARVMWAMVGVVMMGGEEARVIMGGEEGTNEMFVVE